MIRTEIDELSRELALALHAHVGDGGRLCVIKAPPGSGKTYTLLNAVAHAVACGQRVAIAAQTNAQADDIWERLQLAHPSVAASRFAAKGNTAPDGVGAPAWTTSKGDLPDGPSAVIATTAKWGLMKDLPPFDVLFVDEAWQMSWADFMLLGQISGRFVLIGDPGQIDPVVTIEVNRWETSPVAPHIAAPEIVLRDPTLDALKLELPACRRLPADAVDLIRPFYDFEFGSWAVPEDRWLRPGPSAGVLHDGVDDALHHLRHASTAIVTLPTPGNGPPLELDEGIAALAAAVAERALDRGCLVRASESDPTGGVPIEPCDIGIAATHRVVNSAVLRGLPAHLQDQTTGIRVDTPERWQGLERKLMIVVHPLSGVVHPTSFDLETGRLCVMASRHRAAMVVVSRDHVPSTLDVHIPSAEQAIGRPDVAGRGHLRHTQFWQHIADADGVFPATVRQGSPA